MDSDKEETTQLLNIIVASLAIIFQSLFFIRFKFKVDKAAILILLSDLIVSIIRCIQYGQKKSCSTLDYLQPFASNIKWVFLIYFLFEMSYIRMTLESKSKKEFE